MTTLRMQRSAIFPAQCLNCRAGLVGEFCHLCGQSATTPARITLGTILRDMPNAVWDVNRALPFTLLSLVRRPGHVVRDYLEGRRARLYSPIALLFIVSGAVAVVTSWFHVDSAVQLGVVSTPNAAQLKLASQLLDYYAWLAMATVPFQALGPTLVFRKRLGFGFGEQVIAATMIAAGAAFVGAFALPLEWLLHRLHHDGALRAIVAAVLVLKLAYSLWAYVQLQNVGGAIARWLRAFASYVVSVLVLVAATISALVAVVAAMLLLESYGLWPR